MNRKSRLLIALTITILFVIVITATFYAADDDDVPDDGVRLGNPLIAPFIFNNIEDFLTAVGKAKFSESYYGCASTRVHGLRTFREFYVPYFIWYDFCLTEIQLHCLTTRPPPRYLPRLTYHRGDDMIRFMWFRDGMPDGWEQPDHLIDPDLWGMSWGSNLDVFLENWRYLSVQHGYSFMVSIPSYFVKEEATDEEAIAFATAIPLNAWQLQGDTVSISVQGMEYINVFDAGGSRIIIGTERLRRFGSISVETFMLYRSNNDGTTDRIGYRVLVSPELRRYQFVLEPGVYTFLAEGIIGEQDLLIRHFADHEVISETNYAATLAQQPGSQFILTVDGLAAEHNLRLAEDMSRLSLTLGSPVITDQNSGATLIMDAIPQLEDGRTLVPIRFITEGLGADVLWDEETQTVTIKLDEHVISLTIGELGDGMDVPARLFDGRTMVPLRFVAERLGAIVTWDFATETIEIIRA